ncbi:MAG: portal protein [Desulfuromonadaceae bacterium]
MAEKAKKKSPEENVILLQEIRDRYELCQNDPAERENRESFIEDIEFENGKQWDEKVEADRSADGRPCLVINKTQQITKQILGDARQNKINIKVKPVDGISDPALAEVFNGIIKNIENQSQAETAYDTGLSYSVRGGWGYLRVLTQFIDEDSMDQDIKIERVVNPLSIYCDPNAKKLDRSDARFYFVTEDVAKKTYEKDYPNSTVCGAMASGLGDQEKTWIADETVRVVEYFRVEEKKEQLYQVEGGATIRESRVKKYGGKVVDGFIVSASGASIAIIKERTTNIPVVEWYKTNGIEILEGPKEVPCKYIPIIFIPGDEVWIEGKQKLRSAIKWSKDPNRLYNWARSTAVETMAQAPIQPFILTPGEVQGFEPIWDEANKKPFPYLLYNDTGKGNGRPQRQQPAVVNQAADREAMLASDDIKSTSGKYDASLGAAGNETSGKAINARQRQGDIGTFVFIDNHVHGITFLGRVLVDMIPRVMDGERVVRLLGEDGAESWATINKAVRDPLQPGRTIIENDVTIGKYDVVATAGTAYATKRQEAVDGMIQLAQAFPPAVPVLAPRIAKNSDWPEAQEIGDELKALAGPPPGAEQPQGPPPPSEKEQLSIEGQQLVNEERKMRMAKNQEDITQLVQEKVAEALVQIGLIQAPNGQ